MSAPAQSKSQIVILGAVAFLLGGMGTVVVSRKTSSPASDVAVTRTSKSAADTPAPKVDDKKDAPTVAATSSVDETLVAANESAAIAMLRSIQTAQAMVQASGMIDTDGDGMGEYGWLGELAGTTPYRIDGGDGRPMAGPDLLQPAVLAAELGGQNGLTEDSGYLFRVFLPGRSVGGKCAGLAPGGALPDPQNGEVLWSCYAWPVSAGSTGRRAFFVNQEGDILATPNTDRAYSGPSKPPMFDAAYTSEHPGDMSAPPTGDGTRGNDRHLWTLVPFEPSGESESEPR